MQEKVGKQGRLISPCLKAGALRHILVKAIMLVQFAVISIRPAVSAKLLFGFLAAFALLAFWLVCLMLAFSIVHKIMTLRAKNSQIRVKLMSKPFISHVMQLDNRHNITAPGTNLLISNKPVPQILPVL